MFIPSLKVVLAIGLTLLVLSCSPQEASVAKQINSPAPIEIKVVVVTMFEIGADEGDKPGEFQLWKAGQKLDTCLPFAISHHDICINTETGVLGIVTGMGTAKAATAIMALGLDPRFDLTHAYWLVAGIAGVDPADASIGSAAWATWLLDGDLAHQIDAREIPNNWSTGYFPLFTTDPLLEKQTIDPKKLNRHGQSSNGEVYQLDPQLVDWAYALTKDVELNDYPQMQRLRDKYIGYPNAQKLPFVLKGEHLAASTFWHGDLLTQWANNWTHYWTAGQGNFVSSGMEDTGSYQSMIYLDKVQKVDKSRFMVVRTGSNYSAPPKDLSAIENLRLESGENGYAGMQSALESAYLVGSKVVDTIVANWSTFKTTMPYAVEGNTTKVAQQRLTVNNESSASISELSSTANKSKMTAKQLAEALHLEAHVEGGYFRQTFKADHRPTIATENGDRVTMTSIYYLLSAESPIGHFHMNQSDIMHYFHMGDPITYFMLNPDGSLQKTILGPDPTKGQTMQMLVKGGTWKASKIPQDGQYGYGLIGEAVAPGFDYADMQLGKKASLLKQFPKYTQLITELSRD
ncbi:cupin domain-containing protein [Paraglaciecola arctica]|uniref:cupin domain-containing protein n=1 Tax=Paraglaciecola arctica TaxID=1128911 RepID=UPI001C06AEA1|nr:cupin domain-containing protein [Paraglaciecola arctica]MBU3002886.1 cupin domain-containing protein [Paraglaciecola arctica]